MRPYIQNESQVFEELLFSLENRDKPTLIFISVPDEEKFQEVDSLLKDSLKQYQFYDIDLAPFEVVSLHRTLNEKLPDNIRNSNPVSWIVNVMGLGNSLTTNNNGQIQRSPLVLELNFERELLFQKVPYVTILWGDEYFFKTLHQEAPDLWHWVTYYFRFYNESQRMVAAEPESPGYSKTSSQNTERAASMARIEEIETKLAQLEPYPTEQLETTKEKIRFNTQLAEEYASILAFSKAESYYQAATGLAEKIKVEPNLLCELHLGLGNLYIISKRTASALESYQKALTICEANNLQDNLGLAHHGIGLAFAEQRKWEKALEHYNKAIEWYRKTGNEFEMGRSFHQIGRVYEEQRKWEQALENYNKAIEWKQKSGNKYELGSTFHQIGRVYEEQGDYKDAQSHFEQAIANFTEFNRQENLLIANESLAWVKKLSQDEN